MLIHPNVVKPLQPLLNIDDTLRHVSEANRYAICAKRLHCEEVSISGEYKQVFSGRSRGDAWLRLADTTTHHRIYIC